VDLTCHYLYWNVIHKYALECPEIKAQIKRGRAMQSEPNAMIADVTECDEDPSMSAFLLKDGNDEVALLGVTKLRDLVLCRLKKAETEKISLSMHEELTKLRTDTLRRLGKRATDVRKSGVWGGMNTLNLTHPARPLCSCSFPCSSWQSETRRTISSSGSTCERSGREEGAGPKRPSVAVAGWGRGVEGARGRPKKTICGRSGLQGGLEGARAKRAPGLGCTRGAWVLPTNFPELSWARVHVGASN
jgi:hypothetical protein